LVVVGGNDDQFDVRSVLRVFDAVPEQWLARQRGEILAR
jgi:hypothetical protein